RFAALIQHLVGEAHEAAVTLRSQPVLDHLALDVDRVADDRGRLDVERAVEKGEPRVLHRRQEQALGEGVHQRAGHRASLDGARRIVCHGKKLLGEPGEVDERRDVGLADGAPVGAEPKAGLEVVESEAAADDLRHFLSKLRRARSKASCMLLAEVSIPRIISIQASADAACSRRSSAMASSLFLRKFSSWRSYSAFIPAWALRAFSSQRTASAFQASICVFSF